ncbi:MAG: LEA type 2 family protein [Desulfobacterales bacterium]|nr:LEA type 2 family protein [Desulfobacterales bacterium]
MYKKLNLFLICLMTLSIGSCASLQQLIQEPVVEFETMSVEDMTLFDGTFLFNFKITNPNPLGISVRRVNYDLKINGKPFIKSILSEGIRLPAGGSGFMELPVSISYMDIFETVSDFINNDTVKYDLACDFTIGSFTIPYQTSGEINVPKLPKVSLKNVDLTSISFSGASMVFALELINKNDFTVLINSLDYNINLAGAEFVNGATKSISPIDSNGKTRLEIPVNISFLELGMSAYNILKDNNTDYELGGDMKFQIPGLGEKSFPFNRSGNVRLNK